MLPRHAFPTGSTCTGGSLLRVCTPARQWLAGATIIFAQLALTLAGLPPQSSSDLEVEPVAATRVPAPLLDPSMVTEVLHFEDQFGDTMRARAVCVPGAERGTAEAHLDVYGAGGELLGIPENLLGTMKDILITQGNLTELCGVEDEDIWNIIEASRRWRVGHYPAVICQVDSQLSIAEEIRTGRLVHNLFNALYSDELWEDHKHNFTYRGINIGAGAGEDETDPLHYWALSFGERVLLIDGDQARLIRAMDKLVAEKANFRSNHIKEIVPFVGMVTPNELENGPMHDAIVTEARSGVDVLKIDIDSFDCAVLQVIIQQLDVSVVILESQPLAPPPIKFARQWHGSDPLRKGFYGCSLSYQLRILHPRYHLLVFTEDDTIFVHSRFATSLEKLSVDRPGVLTSWTNYPLRFPIDEIDCYRRSRVLPAARRLEETLEDIPDFPLDIRREWALKLQPREALARMWSNLSATWDCTSCEQGRMPEFYSLDL